MILRPYQTELIDQCREAMRNGASNIVITAPCGSGKTVFMTHMLKSAAEKGISSIFCLHRRELINQTIKAFNDEKLSHGIISSGYPTNSEPLVQIASIQTLSRRLSEIKKPKLVVYDECHHIASSSWARIKLALGAKFNIGLTATPERLDGKGLCHHFDTLIQGPSTDKLIYNGYLSDYKVFAPGGPNLKGIRKIGGDYQKSPLALAMNTLTGDIVNEYKKHALGKQTLIFAVTIKHSIEIAKAFNEAGFTCNHVDGETNKNDRDRLVKSFTKKEFPLLTNCELFGEGFNVENIECVILARPTASLSLYRQQVGRALRIAEGKQKAIILDMAGNVHRHGAPSDEIIWSLEGKKNRQLKRNPYKMCKSCYFMQSISKTTCEDCGWEFPRNERPLPTHKDGELIEFNKKELQKKRRLERVRAVTLSELIALGKRRGYKNPYFWGLAVLRGRNKKKR